MNENLLNNNILSSLVHQAAPRVVSAIRDASARTGVNFAYLMEQAAAESSFDEKAKAHGSSATGLYQFIESTWLGMVRKYGEKYGLGAYADKISANGHVSDKALRREILDLRKDPEKSALLAAELAAENKRYLDSTVGGDIGPTEMYLAHFMGAGGAAGFIEATRNNPMETAADIFPREARANYNVFYDSKTGQARTLSEVYDLFARKFGASGSDTAIAAAAPQDSGFDDNGKAALLALQNSGSDTSYRSAGHGGWRAMPSTPLVLSPVELMTMAQMDMPKERSARHPYSYNG